MGQAKLKGKTFEERKAKAIAEGREKVARPRYPRFDEFISNDPFVAMATLLTMRSKRSEPTIQQVPYDK